MIVPLPDPLRDRTDKVVWALAAARNRQEIENAVRRSHAIYEASCDAGRFDLLKMLDEATEFHRDRFPPELSADDRAAEEAEEREVFGEPWPAVPAPAVKASARPRQAAAARRQGRS